jgi:NAD(P)-dependent dehydrogenase (short-subunit alcohol dehydrogenase family)
MRKLLEMKSRTVVITGANRGIGLELAKYFKSLDYKLVAICRHPSQEISDVADQLITGIDLTNQTDIQQVAGKLVGEGIDILINNAGLLGRETLDELNLDSIRQQFEINTIAPLNMTQALLSNLKQSAKENKIAKVALITSRMGSIEDNGSGARYGYRASKSALNAVGKSLSIDLKSDNIAVGLIHPGWVQTEMTAYTGDLSPKQAAFQIAARIQDLNLSNSGQFWHSNGELLPW